ncbi:MAG TPA: DUF3558 domain-containing protein [Pseudonocardiaceae bacterium]
MTRAIVPVALGLVALAALAACSSDNANAVTPSTTSTTLPTSTTSDTITAIATTAPKVTNPLDASKFLQSPCTALTTSDLDGIAVGDAKVQSSPSNLGPDCDWQGGAFGASGAISISWETIDKNGLSDLYAQRANAYYWIPTTVSGYPAVFSDPLADLRSQGSCTINVGVSDSLFFLASTNGAPDANTACSRAQQAAADVIKNLGGS